MLWLNMTASQLLNTTELRNFLVYTSLWHRPKDVIDEWQHVDQWCLLCHVVSHQVTSIPLYSLLFTF